MADPTQNKGYLDSSVGQLAGTPKTAWDQMFMRRDALPAQVSEVDKAIGDIYGQGAMAAPVSGGVPTSRNPNTATLPYGGSYWGNNARESSQMPPAPFTPQSPNTPFRVPNPVTGPMGSGGSDMSGLASNQAMYSPGGANFWGAYSLQSPRAPSYWTQASAPGIGTQRTVRSRYGWGSGFTPA